MTFEQKIVWEGNWPKIVILRKKTSNMSFSGFSGTQISILQSIGHFNKKKWRGTPN